jgi:uncharacterized membrane protein
VTALVCSAVAAIVLLMTALFGHIGGAVVDRQRAQIAADAAALAAVAESGPFGSGHHESVARRYARLNGAELVACVCPSGATAVQVTVAVGDARARARAVVDPRMIESVAVASAEDLNPVLRGALQQLLAAAHGRVFLVSGYRTPARQSELWARAVIKYGSAEAADDWVAPPGHSMHERGLAVDLGGDLDLAVQLVERLDLPLWRPLANEPWHFELVGSR